MIQNTFLFLERVKKGIEKSLWQQGIHDWDAFLNKETIKGISKKRKLYYNRKLIEARKALYNFNSEYFKTILPKSEYYRLYDFFKDDAIYLDIETTGLDARTNELTVIGLFNGIETKTMIRGINLDIKKLKEELKDCKLIITFNGASFDIPFINKRYPGILPNVPNLDLRTTANKLNLNGGLKNIEKALGIRRNNLIENMHGGDAATLWRIYRATNDPYYLNLLIAYNEEDIINLKKLAEHCISALKQNFPKHQSPSLHGLKQPPI